MNIINGDHQQNENRRRSSIRKSSMGGMKIKVGNVSYYE
jgi:hypothetical protein